VKNAPRRFMLEERWTAFGLTGRRSWLSSACFCRDFFHPVEIDDVGEIICDRATSLARGWGAGCHLLRSAKKVTYHIRQISAVSPEL
jgi:hypothetical protein